MRGWRRWPACGHYVDMEKPDELAKLVSNFVNAN